MRCDIGPLDTTKPSIYSIEGIHRVNPNVAHIKADFTTFWHRSLTPH